MAKKTNCKDCGISLTVHNKQKWNILCKDCYKRRQALYMRDFRKTKRGKDVQSRYSKSEKGKETQKRSDLKRSKDPKYVIRSKLRHLVRTGQAKVPLKCEFCGVIAKLEAHHHAYCLFYALDVVWLCVTCHTKEHREGYDKKKKY